jgi:hypothetical protein
MELESSTSSRLPARIIMNSSCGGWSQAEWKLVGQEPEQTPALHAHLHPVAHLGLFLDFLEEVVLVAGRHLLIHIAHLGLLTGP